MASVWLVVKSLPAGRTEIREAFEDPKDAYRLAASGPLLSAVEIPVTPKSGGAGTSTPPGAGS